MFKLCLLMLIASLLVASDDNKGKKGYRLIHEKVPWDKAFTLCQNDGGRLATIESPEEDLASTVFLEKETNQGDKSSCYHSEKNDFDFWIAGQRLNEGQPKVCDRPFYWKFPKDLEKPLEYTHWAPGEPACAGGNEACMEVQFSNGFHWKSKDCSALMCPLCQIV